MNDSFCITPVAFSGSTPLTSLRTTTFVGTATAVTLKPFVRINVIKSDIRQPRCGDLLQPEPTSHDLDGGTLSRHTLRHRV